MDALKDSYRKAAEFVAGLPPSGRFALLTVPALLAVAFAALLWNGPADDEAPVSWGKVFATDELRSAEQALIEAGLTEFRTSGQRIFAPAAEVDAYNAALMVDGRLPGDSLSEFERQFDKAGIFTSREQLAGLRDIALRKEVRKTLAAVPDIESADVLWSTKESGSWPRRSKKTAATVSLMPRRGAPLPPGRVASIRRAVANMVPDLAEEDVTVFDQSTGAAHAHTSGGPLDDPTRQALEAHTERYRGTIREALAYIPGALVNVSVDLGEVRRQVERQQTVDSKQTVTLEADERTRNRSSVQAPAPRRTRRRQQHPRRDRPDRRPADGDDGRVDRLRHPRGPQLDHGGEGTAGRDALGGAGRGEHPRELPRRRRRRPRRGPARRRRRTRPTGVFAGGGRDSEPPRRRRSGSGSARCCPKARRTPRSTSPPSPRSRRTCRSWRSPGRRRPTTC